MLDPNEFRQKTKDILAKRAGQMCSNCNRHTSGAHSSDDKAVIIGEAAHISGQKLGSSRYLESLTPAERRNAKNGIWVCADCHKLIDSDEAKFTIEVLLKWKKDHEEKIIKKLLGDFSGTISIPGTGNLPRSNEEFEKIFSGITGAQLHFLLLLRQFYTKGQNRGMPCSYATMYHMSVVRARTHRYDGWITPFFTAYLEDYELVYVEGSFYKMKEKGFAFIDYTIAMGYSENDKDF